MTITEILLFVLGILSSIGILAGGVGYLVSTFRKGSTEQKSEIVSSADQLTNFWKEQADGYKTMLAEKESQWNDKDKAWNIKFTELTREVGEINGKLAEKEKQANSYLEILQNRDPEMKTFMEFMLKAIKDQAESHKKIVEVLNDIHTMATAEHERDFSITSTITKSV